MRAFVDTSSLFKKYVEEDGSEQLSKLLNDVLEIAVSPLTWTEINSIFARRLRENLLSSQQAAWLKSQAERDFSSFHRVHWNDALENKAVDLMNKCSILTLDAIQLASGILSKADVFVTSDKKLFEEANKVIRETRFI